uniref:Uncharacterized protein n=1 Tax=Ananas comosus var. bracteatus TaxID=296719 RepID=A0A6V7PZN3_ANACO|nr:unnamed protein product [Ananas comosus var. bracteatus]
MDQSGQLNGLDKFHSAFQQVWKSKNEFQRCWNGFDIDRREVEPKRSETAFWSCCTGTRVMAVPMRIPDSARTDPVGLDPAGSVFAGSGPGPAGPTPRRQRIQRGRCSWLP